MGTLTDSLFAVLMSWVRALVSGIWALFSSEHTTVLEFLGKNWIMIAVVMIAAGLMIDWLIWLMRWQPYHIWAQRVKRLLHLDRDEEEDEVDDEEEDEDEAYRAHAAVLPERATASMMPVPEEEPEDEMQGELFIDEQEAQDAISRASEVPDEALGVYPGMRYGAGAQGEPLSSTQRFSVLTAEGPGSAEVARRRAEIDAWQSQMQEEARMRAQAERAAREAQQKAEQERLAREAAEAEAARIAEEERLAREAAEAEAARIAEEERLAQEEYARRLAEYEVQKAQYERELAEYERQKAAYDAQMAQLAAQQAAENAAHETAQELAPQTGARRRRAVQKTYSDYVSGDAVTSLPDPPAWPQMEEPAQKKKKTTSAKTQTAKTHTAKPQKQKQKAQTEKQPQEHGLLSRMAKMIEPQEEELAAFRALPPRVDMHDAYKPAKTPQKTGGRSKR